MPDSLTIPLDRLATLAVEHWRLATALAPTLQAPSAAPLRHALRKIDDFLKSCDLETRCLDGQPYDPGLAARVADTLDDPSLPPGVSPITETLSPMILHKNTVLRPADVIISQRPRS